MSGVEGVGPSQPGDISKAWSGVNREIIFSLYNFHEISVVRPLITRGLLGIYTIKTHIIYKYPWSNIFEVCIIGWCTRKSTLYI